MTNGMLEGDDLEMWHAFLGWSQHIHGTVNRAVTQMAELSVPEFELLTRLWLRPEKNLPQLELMEELHWSASRLSHLLRRMESRGLVRRGSEHGKARVVSLVDRGASHLERAFEVHGRAFREVMIDRLSLLERQTLMRIMAGRQNEEGKV